MHPMLMPVHYMPPGTVQLHPGHPAAMAAGGPGPSIRSNSLSMSESGAPGSDASFGRCHVRLDLRSNANKFLP